MSSRLAVVLFVFFLLAPSVGQHTRFSGVFAIPKTELRYPNPRPALPISVSELQSYPKAFDLFVDDHFGFRSQLVALNNLLQYKMGALGSERVLLGKNGWLFLITDRALEQYRGTIDFGQRDAARWLSAMETRRAWLAERGIPFVVVVTPGKPTVYPEYMPNWFSAVEPTPLQQITTLAPQASRIDFLDLTPSLLNAKATARMPLYYRTDSHWNPYGALVAYGQIMHRVRRYFPKLQPLRESNVEFKRIEGRKADLALMLNLSWYFGEQEMVMEPLFPSRMRAVYSLMPAKPRKADKFILGVARIKSLVRSDLPGNPKAIIFRDSFTNALAPYFAETFRATLLTNHAWNNFDCKLVESYKPDIVLYIMSERALVHAPKPFCG